MKNIRAQELMDKISQYQKELWNIRLLKYLVMNSDIDTKEVNRLDQELDSKSSDT